jgi:hypothetical protein
MILARFEFKPEYAADFIASKDGKQTIIQREYDDVQDLIEDIKSFEYAIKDCLAVVDGKMLLLSSFKAK